MPRPAKPSKRSSLAEEIGKSSDFASLQEEAFLNIASAYFHLTAPLQRLLKSHQLSLSLYNALRIINGHSPKGVTIGVLTDQLIFPAPDTTRLVERLEAAALAKRQRGTEDRRTVRVIITAKGRRLISTVRPLVEQYHSDTMAHVCNADLEKLITALDDARHPPAPDQ